tara:strand:- start:280 stop:6750 length:6471 start_codon:yes stop_codon:yes gene_type:complete
MLMVLQSLFAQLSKVHYIPPIAAHGAATSNAYPLDQHIYISTPSDNNVSYSITPVGGAPASIISDVVSNSFPNIHNIGTGPTNFAIINSLLYGGTVIDDKGYIITADSPIYVAIRLRAGRSGDSTPPQAGALVSKGLSALGTSFRTGTYNSQNPGSDNYLNFVSLMASEDNTQVVIDNLDRSLDLAGIVSPGGAGTFSKTFTLDKGETYLLSAEVENATANREGLIGVLIESDKPIVVNCGSANGSFHNGSGRDYGIDQIVGADKIGSEYVFVRGSGSSGWENILIVANEDDTGIFVDGGSTSIATLTLAGDHYIIEGGAYSTAGSGKTLYIKTSKNVFAWQGIGGTGSEANQGMFFVPPLSCQSQGEVNNIPFIENIGSAFFPGYVTVVTNQTASVTFSDLANSNKSLDDSSFSGGVNVSGPETVAGANYKAYIIQNLSGNVSINSTEELYCAYYNQSGAATSGGFYAGFISAPETVLESPVLSGEKCLPNVQLRASGVDAFDSYTWFYDNGTGYVDLGVSNNPYLPNVPGAYKVRAQITCDGVTSVAYSEPAVVSNCPPDFDGDGINDNIDLDLDNDGILNTYESFEDYQLDISDINNPLIIKTATITTAGAYTVSNVLATDSSIVQTAIGEITSSLASGGKQNQIEWNFNDKVNFKLIHSLNNNHSYLDGEMFIISTSSVSESISLLNPNNDLLVDTNYDNDFESGLTLYSSNEIRFKFNSSVTASPTFSFLGQNMQNLTLTHINNSGTSTSVLKWDLFLHQNDLDTNGNGTPDAYDLDSDGDGCSDVIEAGFTDSDPIPDGILGASPVTVSTLGLVAGYDGYAIPRDGDLTGVYDFQEVGSAALPSNITGHPNSESICLGGIANFEVQTDLSQPIFQWQMYNGTDWVDLSDNAIYSNTSSQLMSVTPADNTLDNSSYRVTVAKGGFLCNPAISSTVSLSMDPPKVFNLDSAVFALSETDSPTSFNITLQEAPASNVVLDISNPDITEAIVSPTQVTFTPANWNVPQSIGITPNTDGLLDGDQIIYPSVSVNVALTQNCYTNAEAKTVTLSILDVNLAGFEIVVLDNLSNENGDEASFTVKLLSKPSGVVTLDLSSSDLTEGQLSQSNVQFSPFNWDTPQTIIVTGLPDPVPFKDGNIAYQIITGNVSSTDANYNALDGSTVADVDLINQDNSGPGIELTVVGGSAVTDENGTSFAVQFNLLSQPLGGADVSFGLGVLGDAAEVILSSTSITIANLDWNKPFNNQITLTGVDDAIIDGDIILVLETLDPVSTDGTYDALDASDIADLNFRNLDNDQAGFSVGAISNNLSENENIASFTVVLDIKPNTDVFLNITSNDDGEVAVDNSFQQLQFTPLNWNIPQTVLVSGVDETIIDGDQFTQIVVSVDGSSDANFTSEPAQNVNVINIDNDVAQIILTPIDQLSGEDGSTGSFSVHLSATPSTPVQISWASTNINEGTLASTTITLSPSNWDQPQIITVVGVDDLIPIRDGAINYNIFINAISSTDPYFGNIIPGTIAAVAMTNQDNDFAGVTLYLLEDDYQTDENGDQVKVAFSLNTKPLNDEDVTLPVALQDNIDEIALLETEITIENENWDNPESNVLTLSGLDDFLLDGSQEVNFVTGDPQSLDTNYEQLNADSVADLILVNLDNDFPGILVSGAITAVSPAESGTVTTSYKLVSPLSESTISTTLSIELNVQPNAEVIITFIVPDASELGLNKTFLTFTPENWNQPQTITLIGIDDYLFDGDISTSLLILVDPSTPDPDYLTADYITLDLTNEDDDVDHDNDGLHERFDNCPLDFNPEQEDLDGDGLGDPCDPDIDGDGVTNDQEAIDRTESYDNCDFLDASITLIITSALDCDRDGVPDDIDLDDDNDGILDTEETQEDFDQNGKGNSSDLDSDGDGCFDTVEAGFEDPDQDGILGSSPVEVDAQGRVISSNGYTKAADLDNSGQYDYLELPVSPTISLQPSLSVVVVPNQETVLSIDLSSSEMFFIQWQILQPPSNDWQDLQASTSFLGVNSKNLVLVNPQESWVNWKLRAAISSKNYSCDPINFSQETLLIYQSLFIPNAFSPDNDGVNENLIIQGLGQFPDHQLTIYSRWETLVLKEAPYKNDWNGEFRASYSNSNDQNLPEGTYFYILELGNGQPPLKGFIYLKR